MERCLADCLNKLNKTFKRLLRGVLHQNSTTQYVVEFFSCPAETLCGTTHTVIMTRSQRTKVKLEKTADNATRWIGSTSSILVHTFLFVGAFTLPFFGVSFERVLLVLTTAVSLEAIYLAIFIQMSVNKNTKDIEIIQEDVEEIQEDIEEIEEDVDEIQKDVEEIEKDVDEIQEDIEDIEEDSNEDQKIEQKEAQAIIAIQTILTQLQKEIEHLKK